MKTLVCLPTYNEIKSVEAMIDRIRAINLDIILCDQDSTDGTIEKAKLKGIEVYRRDGYGKGWGFHKALKVAKDKGYDVLVMIDCDCTYLPEDIPSLLDFIEDRDMVVGRRNMKSIQFSHRLVNIAHTQLINLLFGCRLGDINSGLRAMRVNSFFGLLSAKGFDIEAEISSVAAKKRFRVKEVPIRYEKRVGRSKIRASDTFEIINRILMVKFRNEK